LSYRDLPALLDEDGRATFHVVADDDGSIVAQSGLHVFTAEGESWASLRNRLYRWERASVSAESSTFTIPMTSTEEMHLAAADPVLLVSRGADLLRIEIGEEGGRVARARVLSAPPLWVHAHPHGALIVERRTRRLLALDPETLEPRWAVENVCCVPLGLTESFGFAFREIGDEWTLTEIDLARGIALRELPVTGPPVARTVQSGTRLWALLEDDTGRLGERTSRLFLEEIDLATRERRVVDLDAEKAGIGSVYSSLVVVTEPGGAPAAVATLVNGERGRLRWWADGQLSETAFPEGDPNRGQRNLSQLGPSLVAAVGPRLHVFDVTTQDYRGAIHFPDIIRRITVVANDLLVETDLRSYRLRPGEPQSREGDMRPAYVRVQPYRFGNPGALTDGDSTTSWRFVGQEAHIDVVFHTGTVVPQIFLNDVHDTGDDGVVTSVRTTYLERERERETDVLTNDLSGSSPHELTNGIRIARRVTFTFRCDCPERVPRCRACVVGDLNLGNSMRK